RVPPLILFFPPLWVGGRSLGLLHGRRLRFFFRPFFGQLQYPAVTAIIRVMIAGSLRAGCTSPPQTGSSVKSRSPQADPQPRAGDLQGTKGHPDQLGDLFSALSSLDQIPDLLDSLRR